MHATRPLPHLTHLPGAAYEPGRPALVRPLTMDRPVRSGPVPPYHGLYREPLFAERTRHREWFRMNAHGLRLGGGLRTAVRCIIVVLAICGLLGLGSAMREQLGGQPIAFFPTAPQQCGFSGGDC